jgi:hypothetical protein
MNYCSLEDAWGKKTSMLPEKIIPPEQSLHASYPMEESQKGSSQKGSSQKEQSQRDSFQKESFSMFTKDNERLDKIKKHVEEIYNCDGIMNHLRHCRSCYNKMKQNFPKESFRSSLTEHFEDLVDDNRDSIVLILVGISILLFINLINNVTKNN